MFAATFKLNFHLVINRQPSKALKFNRQSLKLKKNTVNLQSYHHIETLLQRSPFYNFILPTKLHRIIY